MNLLISFLFSIVSYGAIGDGVTDNTKAINRTITECHQRGGGTVLVPEGTFVSGTIQMKSNVTLYLEKGAVLKGSSDLAAYDYLRPLTDLSKYETGQGTVNFNSATDPIWSQAFVHFVGVHGGGIQGEGTIDGSQLFNPLGEEHQRGPHTILIANSSDLRMGGVQIIRSSNYAILGYEVERSQFKHLHITGGWDGIHIRGGKDIVIDGCEMHTGDDAIAGGYWRGMDITHCVLNSSCNGIRIIQPVSDLLVEDCIIYGPGEEEHITSGQKASLYAISIEPGGWGTAPGRLDNITLRRIQTYSVLSPLSVTLSEENTLGRLVVEDLVGRDITRMALSVKSWGTSRAEEVRIRRADLEFRGIDDPEVPKWFELHSTNEWPYFPSYGMYFRNVDRVTIEESQCTFIGRDYREAIVNDNVWDYQEYNVLWQPASGER